MKRLIEFCGDCGSFDTTWRINADDVELRFGVTGLRPTPATATFAELHADLRAVCARADAEGDITIEFPSGLIIVRQRPIGPGRSSVAAMKEE